MNMSHLYWLGYGSALVAWFVAFVIPIAPFLVFVVILVFADLYTGLRAAKHKGNKIHSKGLKRTIEKIVLYYVAILLSEGMEHVFFEHYIPLTYTTTFAICLVEFKSNIENIEIITKVNVWNSIKKMFTKKL